jgi:hypothetical protein
LLRSLILLCSVFVRSCGWLIILAGLSWLATILLMRAGFWGSDVSLIGLESYDCAAGLLICTSLGLAIQSVLRDPEFSRHQECSEESKAFYNPGEDPDR